MASISSDLNEPAIPAACGEGIALALGGGGALGWAHIGVLRVLQEEQIPVAAAAGTSMGAIAAVSFATGELDAMEQVARNMHGARILTFLDPTLTRGALLGGRRIMRELSTHLRDMTFADLAMPVATVAADLETGEEVRIGSGLLTDAVRASIAIPSVFSPVPREGRWLIDGGMVANLPIGAARDLAPGRPVVVVNLMGDYLGHVSRPGRPLAERNAFAIGRAGFLMMIANYSRAIIALEKPEVVIDLPIGHFATADYHQANELIALGRLAAIEALPRIRDALAMQQKAA